MSILGTIKKAVKQAIGIPTGGPKAAKAPTTSGAVHVDTKPVQTAKRKRSARGRDATILTAGSNSYSRTLLG